MCPVEYYYHRIYIVGAVRIEDEHQVAIAYGR